MDIVNILKSVGFKITVYSHQKRRGHYGLTCWGSSMEFPKRFAHMWLTKKNSE